MVELAVDLDPRAKGLADDGMHAAMMCRGGSSGGTRPLSGLIKCAETDPYVDLALDGTSILPCAPVCF